MRKALFVLFILMAGVCQAQTQDKLMLLSGTDVPVVLEQTICAHDLKESQMIELQTADDVKSKEGEVVIPKGSRALARVRTGLKQRVLTNQKRRLIIDIKEVQLPDGTKVALCDGVISFTTNRNTGDLSAVPLVRDNKNIYYVPTGYVMHAKVEVTQIITK